MIVAWEVRRRICRSSFAWLYFDSSSLQARSQDSLQEGIRMLLV
jgi:hypothetical protein